MNNQKIISFDLQGTISSSDFSDYFWFKTLPNQYAIKNNISFSEGQKKLGDLFEKIGKYNFKYYDQRYWIKELQLDWDFRQLCLEIAIKPSLNNDMISLIEKLYKEVPLIILSGTTKEFISFELGDYKKYFQHIFSSIDDFDIAGKPPEVFDVVAKKLNHKASHFFHVGDSFEMDVQNGRLAGWQTFYWQEKTNIEELKQAINIFL